MNLSAIPPHNKMVNKNPTAVLGVVFPRNRRFLKQYLDSLGKQSYKKFDLILINDGVAQLEKYAPTHGLQIKIWDHMDTPAKIRQYAINRIRREGYRYIIFTDSDDFYNQNRIAMCISLLKRYDIIVNDLVTISDHKKVLDNAYFSKRLRDETLIGPKDLFRGNMMGFTNTGLRTSCLKKRVFFPASMPVVDWFFFSSLLNQGARAIFTNKTKSSYRLHGGNIMGLAIQPTAPSIKKALDIKCQHHKNLSDRCEASRRLHRLFRRLRENFMGSHAFRKQYIEQLKAQRIKNPFWWEEIRLPQELGLCG